MSDDAKQTTTSKSARSARRILLSLIAVLAISVVVMLYGQRVFDHITAAYFTPSAEVTQVHDNLKLTWLGNDLLYASKPSIETGQQFNQHCQTSERTAAILGCYYNRTVYLYNVTNQELSGAKEATAAHEMLHAAYDRLQIWEKNRINSLLQVEYQKIKDQPEMKKLVEYYTANEPGELNNELHSIIGTTIKSVSPELENYYAQYFTDRSAIVTLYTQYSTVFETIDAQSTALSTKINSDGPPLQADLSSYEAKRTVLSNDIQTFNQRASGSYFTSISSFQAAHQALVARSDALEAERTALNERVAAYNVMIQQYNSLSVRVNQLNSSINGVTELSPGV